MRNDSERQINISFGSPVEPEVMRRPTAMNARVVREIGAQADGNVVTIDDGNGRLTYYDRGTTTSDDVRLGHSAEAPRLSDY